MKKQRIKLFILICTCACAALPTFVAGGEQRAPSVQAKDLQTFSAVGKEQEVLQSGKEVELFSRRAKGCLTHFWYAGDPRAMLRIYVDGERKASIAMELTMGHAFPSRQDAPAPWGVRQMGRIGGVFNNYRIPFGKSVRVTIDSTTKTPYFSAADFV